MPKEKDTEYRRIAEKLKRNTKELFKLTVKMEDNVKKLKPALSKVVTFKGRYDINRTEREMWVDWTYLKDELMFTTNFISDIDRHTSRMI